MIYHISNFLYYCAQPKSSLTADATSCFSNVPTIITLATTAITLTGAIFYAVRKHQIRRPGTSTTQAPKEAIFDPPTGPIKARHDHGRDWPLIRPPYNPPCTDQAIENAIQKQLGATINSLQNDSRHVPHPHRFFDILTSPYKPLGYCEYPLPSEATLQWTLDANRKIPGNCRLPLPKEAIDRGARSRYFYNKDYLTKLLEFNVDAFPSVISDAHGKTLHKDHIFDANGHVLPEGVEYFIQNTHWAINKHAPLLALVHIAFGDEEAYYGGIEETNQRHYQLIRIPNEPGIRDVITLHQKFPEHRWKTIQSLLRFYKDPQRVATELQGLDPSKQHFAQEDGTVREVDSSCIPFPVVFPSRIPIQEYIVQGPHSIVPFTCD